MYVAWSKIIGPRANVQGLQECHSCASFARPELITITTNTKDSADALKEDPDVMQHQISVTRDVELL